MVRNVVFAIIVILASSKNAACQYFGKVGDTVNLDELNIYFHRVIARHIGTKAPDYQFALSSGKLITNENTKGKVQVFLIWEPSDTMFATRPFCPILELANKDTNLIFAAIITDTSGLTLRPRCSSGAIPYAVTKQLIHERFEFRLGYPNFVIVGKNGTIANIITAVDFRMYKEPTYEALAESIERMLQ
ncbi:MAG: hypothetical protein ABI378_09705 [Chitinophagaceae bacterium]